MIGNNLSARCRRALYNPWIRRIILRLHASRPINQFQCFWRIVLSGSALIVWWNFSSYKVSKQGKLAPVWLSRHFIQNNFHHRVFDEEDSGPLPTWGSTDYGKHFLPRTIGLVIDTDGLTSQIKCRLLRLNPFILGTTDYADRWIRWEGKVYPQSRADSLSLRTYGWIIISNPFCVTRPHGQRVPTTLIRVHPLRPASRNSAFVFSQIL